MADKVTSITIPWLTVILRADPTWNKDKQRELEYDFPLPGRSFYGNPASRGPYGAGFSLGFSKGFRSPTADNLRGGGASGDDEGY